MIVLCDNNHLLSSSTIFTKTVSGEPRIARLGNDDRSISSRKFSSISNILSLIIGTSNVALVTPAENVTVYGPGV